MGPVRLSDNRKPIFWVMASWRDDNMRACFPISFIPFSLPVPCVSCHFPPMPKWPHVHRWIGWRKKPTQLYSMSNISQPSLVFVFNHQAHWKKKNVTLKKRERGNDPFCGRVCLINSFDYNPQHLHSYTPLACDEYRLTIVDKITDAHRVIPFPFIFPATHLFLVVVQKSFNVIWIIRLWFKA